MTYEPKQFFRGDETVWSEDRSDEFRLLYEGWAFVEPQTTPLELIDASLADLAALKAYVDQLFAEFDGGGTGTGPAGESAYQIAVANGFVGTEVQWLQSLQGAPGTPGRNGSDGLPGTPGAPGAAGKSAYEVAVSNGYTGTISEWLQSLRGANGLPGAPGESPYQIAVRNGFVGTEAQWLATLGGIPGPKGDPGTNGTNGAPGAAGKSAYQVAVANGFLGTEAQWLESLKGSGGIPVVAGTKVVRQFPVNTHTIARPATAEALEYVGPLTEFPQSAIDYDSFQRTNA